MSGDDSGAAAWQVPPLTDEQMAFFKREGYVVLPAALSPKLLACARDHVWATLSAEVPRLRRDDPTTWATTLDSREVTGATEPPPLPNELIEENKYFSCGGHRFYIHCANEPLFRNLFPLALRSVVEQLLGKGTVLLPGGPNADGLVRGPTFNSMNGDTHKNLVGVAKYKEWVNKGPDEYPPPMVTEELAVPPHSPFTGVIHGTRGVYCTLPQGRRKFDGQDTVGIPADDLQDGIVDDGFISRHTAEGGYMGAHADTCTLTNIPGIHADDRTRLRATCYLDDCPPDCGGFTVWPRTHVPLWQHVRDCKLKNVAYHPYQDSKLQKLKRTSTGPVETYGPAGTVVLWHQMTVHMAGVNHSTDCVRMAMIHDFKKTPASVSDSQLIDFEDEDIWRDWSHSFRECVALEVHGDGTGQWKPYKPRL